MQTGLPPGSGHASWLASLVSTSGVLLMPLGGWGGTPMIIVASGVLILAQLYVWRRPCVCNMFANVLVHVAGFMAAQVQPSVAQP